MKIKNIVNILIVGGIVAGLGVLFINRLLPEKVEVKTEVEYLEGKADTVTVVETKVDTIPLYVVEADTAYIDKENRHRAETDFKIEKNSATIEGKIKYNEPYFNFEDVIIKYPEITRTITQIDTLLKKITIKELPMFYEDGWFWGMVGSLVFLLLSIL